MRSGALIDKSARSLKFWISDSYFRPYNFFRGPSSIYRAWPGWNLSYNPDAIYGQLALSGRNPLEIHIPNRLIRQALLRSDLNVSLPEDMDAFIQGIREHALQPGVQAARGAICNPKPDLDRQSRQRMLAEILLQHEADDACAER